MKSKEDMIDAMAMAIWDADFRKGVEYPELLTLASKSGYLNAKTSVEILTMQAEAALKALCGALPELTKKPEFSGFIDGLVMTDAPKLYNQLKQLGK